MKEIVELDDLSGESGHGVIKAEGIDTLAASNKFELRNGEERESVWENKAVGSTRVFAYVSGSVVLFEVEFLE